MPTGAKIEPLLGFKRQNSSSNDQTPSSYSHNTNFFFNSFFKKESNKNQQNDCNTSCYETNPSNNMEKTNQYQGTSPVSNQPFNTFSHYHPHIPTLNMSM